MTPKTQLLIGFEWPRLSPKILVTPAPTTPPLLLIPIPIPIQMTIVLFVSTPMGSTISSTSAMLARLSKPRNRPSLLSHLPEFPCVPFVFLSLCSFLICLKLLHFQIWVALVSDALLCFLDKFVTCMCFVIWVFNRLLVLRNLRNSSMIYLNSY